MTEVRALVAEPTPPDQQPRIPSQDRLPRYVAAFVEGALQSYRGDRALVDAYEESRQDIEQRYRPSPGEDAAVQSAPGDTTASRAELLAHLERAAELAGWRVRCIERLLPHLTETESRFVEIRYLSGEWWSQGWTMEDLAEHLGVTDRRLQEVKREVLARFATGFGIL